MQWGTVELLHNNSSNCYGIKIGETSRKEHVLLFVTNVERRVK